MEGGIRLSKKGSKHPSPAFYAIVITISLVLLTVLVISLVNVFHTTEIYADEAREHDFVLQYKPEIPTGPSYSSNPSPSIPNGTSLSLEPTEAESSYSAAAEEDTNLSQLVAQYPDVVGWIYVPATNIDYPFVQASDNSYYLHRNLAGSYLYSGTPFLDHACASDFSDKNSVLYGHNMKNGTMFSTLGNYKRSDVFSENQYFYIILPDRTLTVEIFACSVINSYSPESSFVYNVFPGDSFIEDLRSSARCFRELDFADSDRYVTISTCDYEFSGARVVLTGRIMENN